MVDLKLANSYSAMLFSNDGYQVAVMPMMTTEATEQAERDREAEAAATPPQAEVETSQAVAEAEAITKKVVKAKVKHGKAKEPVAA